MTKRIYAVTLPIAGHAHVVVEADNEEAAIEEAMNQVEMEHIETWEAVEQFHKGNVCYCPHPWEAVAADETPDAT